MSTKKRKIALWLIGCSVVFIIASVWVIDSSISRILLMLNDTSPQFVADYEELSPATVPAFNTSKRDTKSPIDPHNSSLSDSQLVPDLPTIGEGIGANEARANHESEEKQVDRSMEASNSAVKVNPSEQISETSLPKGTQQNVNYTPQVTAEKAADVEKSVTTREKSYIILTILKHFPPSDIKMFQEMARNGISVEEKREVKNIFLERLGEEEYDKLIAIAKKYGLSQGKTYRESVGELES